jgi:small-conductance mechanosensitive channel
MIRNAARLLILIIAGSLILDHLGLASNTLTVVVIVLGILVLLGIRDVLTDVIYGFIILVGQPFSKGDIVQVPGMSEDEWGWVTSIRSRATHISTVDNRTLVIPNRLLGVNQITNYSRPDPSYRMSTDLNLAYGSDFAHVQQILTQATQAVDGVLADKEVDVFFEQFGPSTQVVRVRWWIASCAQEHEMNSRVNAALEAALVTAGLVPAYAALDVHIEREQSETTDGVQEQT